MYTKLAVVAGCWLVLFFAIWIDLYFGVSKAKALGEYRSSEGFRRTGVKFKEYYSALLFSLLFDSLLFFTVYLPEPIPKLPIITVCMTGFYVFTEYRSMRENGDQKARRQQQKNLEDLTKYASILADKESVNKLMDYLEREKIRQDEKNNSAPAADH